MYKSWLAVLLAALGVSRFLAPDGAKIEGRDQPLLKVYVVGGKIGTNCSSDEVLSSGEDVWRGALWACQEDARKLCTAPGSAALNESPWQDLRLNPDRPNALFALIPENDCQRPEDAARIAWKLQKDPTVLAVIGHSTSKTTGRVAEIYAQAGIPLVMPDATAATAPTYYSKHAKRSGSPGASQSRVPNYIRLQPSDDQAQAPAIAYTILQLSKESSRVYLFAGLGGNAKEYSEGLVDRVRELLPGKIPGRPESIEKSENSQAAQKILGQAKPDDIVFFAGYREQAEAILAALEKGYRGRGAGSRPIILLPEACNGLETVWKNFRIYRAGPADTTACFDKLKDDPGLARWRRKEETDPLPISMLYGHDAVQLVVRAAAACLKANEPIARNCVLEKLRTTVFSGACGGYSFREGENLLSSYYVFRSPQAAPLSPEATVRPFEIDPVEIIRMQDIEAGR